MLPGRGVCAEIEPLLMIRPPRGSCAFIIRTACCAHRKAPVRLVSTTACQSGQVDLVGLAGRAEHAGVVHQQVKPAPAVAGPG